MVNPIINNTSLRCVGLKIPKYVVCRQLKVFPPTFFARKSEPNPQLPVAAVSARSRQHDSYHRASRQISGSLAAPAAG
jgi:hypothetical protein